MVDFGAIWFLTLLPLVPAAIWLAWRARANLSPAGMAILSTLCCAAFFLSVIVAVGAVVLLRPVGAAVWQADVALPAILVGVYNALIVLLIVAVLTALFAFPIICLALAQLLLLRRALPHAGPFLADRGDRRKAVCVALRCVVLLLLILALAELRILQRIDRLAVFFVVDRSESVPAEQREAARKYVEAAAAGRDAGKEDRAGVIAFGRLAGIEVIPKDEDLVLESFTTLIEPDATDIAGAVRLASAAFPEGYGKRIVILTDGNENRESVLEEVRVARSLGVVVDVVPITYAHAAEILVEKLIVDPEINVGQPFDVRVVVEATRETEARLRLFENGVAVPQTDPSVRLLPGRKNVIDFKGRRIDEPGRYYYEARLEATRPEDDAITENNVGYGFTVIQGEPQVLLCASEPELDRALVAALEAEKIAVKVIPPEFLPRGVEDYLEYDAIILSNVGAHQLQEDLMKVFESVVKAVGIGFVMIGGESSFGAGGYQGTPVERLLPVDMEIKQQRVLPNGALAIVVHSCELDNGNWWARKVIQQSLRILSPRDYAGVLYYGMSGEQWLFPMTPVAQRQMMLARLNNFNPGDMPSFQPIMQLALKGLQSTPASIKHMVILSDGDPTAPTPDLLAAVVAGRITISAICYGAHGPNAPPEFQNLARVGRGKFYHLRSPANLPEIFIRETANVQRSLISEERFRPNVLTRGSVLQGISAEELPALDGYVLTTPKKLATLHLLHPPGAEDPAQDPVLAAWSYGLGKSIAFTSDAGRRWGRDWTAWSGYQRFWGQCVRWVSRVRGVERFRMTRGIDGERGVVGLDAITADGRLLDGLVVEGQVIGPDFEARSIPVRQTSSGRYTGEFPISRQGTYTVVFSYEIDGRRSSSVVGLSAPYSSEYRHLRANTELLRQIAAVGAGKYHEDADAALEEEAFFSRDFPVSRRVHGIWRELLTAAVVLFFLDVFVRRVVVDYRAVARKTLARVVALVARRAEVVVPGDPRLSTLLERKAKLRETAAALGAPERKPPEPRADARTEGRGILEAPPRADRASPSEPPPAPPPPESPPPLPGGREEEASFTSRLLEAKRRALGKDRRGD